MPRASLAACALPLPPTRQQFAHTLEILGGYDGVTWIRILRDVPGNDR
jgi:hypothetical protein